MKSRGLSNVEKAVVLLRQVHSLDDSIQVRSWTRTQAWRLARSPR